MTAEANVEKTTWLLLVFFFSTASFLQSAKSQMNMNSLRDNRSLFVWGVSDIFSLSTMEPLGCRRCYFSVRGPQQGRAEDGERRDAHFAALAAIWWDGAESFSGVTSFLPLRLAFSRVTLLLTFRISSTSRHHLRYLPNSLFTSFTLTQQTLFYWLASLKIQLCDESELSVSYTLFTHTHTQTPSSLVVPHVSSLFNRVTKYICTKT